MKLSQTGIDLIKSFEGCRLTAYKAVSSEKYYTIGYGHNGSDVFRNQTISQKQADDLLKKDLRIYESGVNTYVKVKVSQNQFDALVSFAYNCGLGALQKSDMLTFINKGDFKNASNEFPKWVHSGGVVLRGLVRRRSAEKDLFDKGTTSTSKPKSNGIKELGKIKVDGVKNFTYVYDLTSDKSKILTKAYKNAIFPIAGSVKGWYEVIYNGRRAYIKSKYCSRV